MPAKANGRAPSALEQAAAIDAVSAASMTADALTRALELHDYRRGVFAETVRHCKRVTRLALRLTEAVDAALAADPLLEFAFRLHDIGMIGVSDSIRVKAGPLTRAELDEVQEHPLLGERIIAPVPYLGQLARDVVGAHHEWWNGLGYPRGLAGDEIPLPARIFALADAYDAMTTHQPYRRALPRELVLHEIAAGAARQFDPALVPVFLDLVDVDAKTPTRARR